MFKQVHLFQSLHIHGHLLASSTIPTHFVEKCQQVGAKVLDLYYCLYHHVTWWVGFFYVLPYNKTLTCHHVLFQSFLSHKTFEGCCSHNKILFPNKQKNPNDIMIIITEVILSSENIFFGGWGRETVQFQMSLPRLCHPSPSQWRPTCHEACFFIPFMLSLSRLMLESHPWPALPWLLILGHLVTITVAGCRILKLLHKKAVRY